MTFKQHLIGLLSLGFLSISGAAMAAPGHGPSRSHSRTTEVRYETPRHTVRTVRHSNVRRHQTRVTRVQRVSPHESRRLLHERREMHRPGHPMRAHHHSYKAPTSPRYR